MRQTPAEELEKVLQDAEQVLASLAEPLVSARPAPNKWSPKELLGHLIDSAANNHSRFVRAQFKDDLIFDSYAQDDWVRLQRYQDADWQELVRLWLAYNRHLVRIIATIPEEILTREHERHSLQRTAWRPVPESQPATLEYVIRDYTGHLNHHLSQIFEDLTPSN